MSVSNGTYTLRQGEVLKATGQDQPLDYRPQF
jgi:hypothetical protein